MFVYLIELVEVSGFVRFYFVAFGELRVGLLEIVDFVFRFDIFGV